MIRLSKPKTIAELSKDTFDLLRAYNFPTDGVKSISVIYPTNEPPSIAQITYEWGTTEITIS